LTQFALRQCKIEDAAYLAEHAIDPSVHGKIEYVTKWMAFNIAHGPSLTVMNEDQIVGAWGIRKVREGIGAIWAIYCDRFKEIFGPDAAWMIRTSIDIVVDEYKFKKVRAWARKDYPAPHRVLRHLGFERMRWSSKEHYFYRKLWD